MRGSSSRMPLLIVLVLILVGVVVAVLASRDTDDAASSPAYPPSAFVEGASLDEWSARHWQWTLSLPVGVNPAQDASGDACMMAQDGPVVFIPRNLAPCTVPEGTIILLPVAGGECSSVEAAPFWGGDEEALRACAAAEASRYVNISVTVDGVPIPNIDAYRTATPLFSAMLPEHNVLAVEPGAGWVVADGHQVLLRPLPPGEHTIIVHAETAEGTVLPDKLLRLTVVEPEWRDPASHDVEVPAHATPVATSGATPIASPFATPAGD